MDCRTTAHIFRIKLGFKHNDPKIISAENIISLFEKKYTDQQGALSYRIDFHFYDYNLVRKTDENGNSGRNIDYEIKKSNRTRIWF